MHKKHEWIYSGGGHGAHKHFVCPICRGAGFVAEPPEQERESLNKYKESLEKEIEAVNKRLTEIGG